MQLLTCDGSRIIESAWNAWAEREKRKERINMRWSYENKRKRNQADADWWREPVRSDATRRTNQSTRGDVRIPMRCQSRRLCSGTEVSRIPQRIPFQVGQKGQPRNNPIFFLLGGQRYATLAEQSLSSVTTGLHRKSFVKNIMSTILRFDSLNVKELGKDLSENVAKSKVKVKTWRNFTHSLRPFVLKNGKNSPVFLNALKV